MDKNKKKEIAQLVKNLSPKKKMVLKLRCSGLLYKQIAKKMGVVKDTINSHFHQIYIIFNLLDMSYAEKQEFFFEIVCPLLENQKVLEELIHAENKDFILIDSKVDEADQINTDHEKSLDSDQVTYGIIRIPEKIKQQVKKDEKALVPYIFERIKPRPRPKEVNPLRKYRWIIIAFIVGAALMYLFMTSGFENPISIGGQASNDNPVVVTATSEAIEEADPTLSIVQGEGSLFTDDFEFGLDDRWTTQYGEIGMSNGKMTIKAPFSDERINHLIVLDSHNWGNFKLSSEIARFSDAGWNTTSYAYAAIVLKHQESGNSFALFINPGRGGLEFGYIDQNGEFFSQAGSLVSGREAEFNLEDGPNEILIECKMNVCVAKINGRQVTSAEMDNVPDIAPIGVWFSSGTWTDNVDQYSARFEYINIESLP